MIEQYVQYALGPHGRLISGFYMQYQFIINSVIVCGAAIHLILKYRKKEEKGKSSI